ncbi:hypothetical protein FQN52_008527 [Onygenales sp. PD_12]|nr:hypothetical protein FQN52_008527 [Onygenales sp. PD_12]
MDRMSFIPGAPAREAIENASGRIFTTRIGALDYADEFILKCPSGPQPLLYQLFLAMLSDGDELEIKFGLRDPTNTEEDDPAGELIGHTWALLKDANGGEKLLWEVGRKTAPISDADAAKAFNAYRQLLGTYQHQQQEQQAEQAHTHGMMPISPPTQIPTNIPLPTPSPPPPSAGPVRSISRALSPSNLYFAAGVMFYFVDLSMVPPSRPEFYHTPLHLSRPMQAFDALLLSALVTVAIGAPPLVFAVLQGNEGLGEMPGSFGRAVYARAPDCRVMEGGVVIVG